MASVERKLRTCPFCGSDALFIRPVGIFPPKYIVICKNTDLCGASLGSYSLTKAEAANKWNKRIGVTETAHDGCRYCPVGCNEHEQEICYRGSLCASARAKAGADYDPEDIFEWKETDADA